jgi:hypothetical protein
MDQNLVVRLQMTEIQQDDFKRPSQSASITGINEDLIHFCVILETWSNGFDINLDAFESYAKETKGIVHDTLLLVLQANKITQSSDAWERSNWLLYFINWTAFRRSSGSKE